MISQNTTELSALEPDSLNQAFLAHPPEGFKALTVRGRPAFLADFDLLTTFDGDLSRVEKWLGIFQLRRFTILPTLFLGSTVSEYTSCSHPGEEAAQPEEILADLIEIAGDNNCQLVIAKDLPLNSPLLCQDENQRAERMVEAGSRVGPFIAVAGQALAYVDIDFPSLDVFLSRMSRSRRKEMRKKLKSKDGLQIEERRTGDVSFADPDFLDELFRLYLNVYKQSRYHFDLLSRDFFQSILNCRENGGIVFLYKKDGELIGYNICFVYRDMLVDKYVGFSYPRCLESNLYFVSWFHNLDFAISNNLRRYIAGWTDPEVKASLGAAFTSTRHLVFIRNPLLRAVLSRLKHLFEPDSDWHHP
ncbi:MAG: GNAT family N-acetyltransferase [Candidatus Obscuribacterales bacterium]